MQIEFFEKDASTANYTALNQYINRIRQETLPNDPPIPPEETIQNLRNIPPFADLRFWVVWNPEHSEIVAQSNVIILHLDDNKHLAQFDISVLPEYRQQGWGRKLLGYVAEAAQQEERRLLMTDTSDRIPGGEVFMTRLGAKRGMEAHINQLDIANLKPKLLENWLAHSQDEFEMGLWDGAYPEAQLVAIAELNDLTNEQPLGDLEIEDMHMTPEQLRQLEQNIFARGNQRWTLFLVDRATGQFAGYTEITWNPNRPEIASQGFTGIYPRYRGRGLGRWLKAAMLDKILKDRPQVKYVRTGNADSNVAMLKINTELGFKPYRANILWQVELQKVLDYLHPAQ